MIDPQQWQELLDAIRALAPNPWANIAVASVGIIGVLLGFGLSTARDALARRRLRSEELAGSVEEKRRDAVDALNKQSVQLVHAWQVLSYRDVSASIDGISGLFLVTGNPEDERVHDAARLYLEALRSSLLSYYHEVPGGTFEVSKAWQTSTESRFRASVARMRGDSQSWVDRRRPSIALAEQLNSYVGDMEALTDPTGSYLDIDEQATG